MKYFFTASWAIICVVVLFIGHSYWKERIAVKGIPNEVTSSVKAEQDTHTGKTELLALTKNWPKSAKEKFQQSVKEKKIFKISFVGSSALGTNETGWAKETAAKVVEAFGNKNIEVSIHTYDVTTTEFLTDNDPLELVADKADLILFEPLLLNDNGQVTIKDSLANLSKIIEAVKTENPDTTFILQPSFPLYGAKYYPLQVDALKNYAEENKLAYLDHWTAWPDTLDPKLKNYLLPDLSGQNEKGNEVWEKFVVDYLVHR